MAGCWEYWDNGDYSAHTHHISNKNGFFEEVAFYSVVGHFLAPRSDFGWSYLQPRIAAVISGWFPPVQGSLFTCFWIFSLPRQEGSSPSYTGVVDFGTTAKSSHVCWFAQVGHVLGTEHNVVPCLHLVIGGELFLQCFFLRTGSLQPEYRVLLGDTLAPYQSNLVEAYDDFEIQVEACSEQN